jgi:hypothetical protein
MAPGIAGAGACAGRWPTPCASGRSQHGWRSAGCRAPTPPASAGACKTVPSGQRRATGASARGGAAGGWTRAPYCGRTVLRPGRVIPSWAGAAQHFLSKICDRTIKRVGPPGYPGATASERATGKAGGGEISNGRAHAQRGETPLRCTHSAPERTVTYSTTKSGGIWFFRSYLSRSSGFLWTIPIRENLSETFGRLVIETPWPPCLDLRACQGSAAGGIVELYGGWLAERDGLVPETVHDAPPLGHLLPFFPAPLHVPCPHHVGGKASLPPEGLQGFNPSTDEVQ